MTKIGRAHYEPKTAPHLMAPIMCAKSLQDIPPTPDKFYDLDVALPAQLLPLCKRDLNRKIQEHTKKLFRDNFELIMGSTVIWFILDHFKYSSTYGVWGSFEALQNVEMHNDDVKTFLSNWDDKLKI